MKLTKLVKFALLTLAGAAILPFSANAQNPNYQHGDLVLFFQDTATSQTLYVSLGNTATVFRDANSNLLNIVNISSQLETAFGALWFNNTTLWAGLAGVWGNASSSLNNTLQNGDPNRTLYVSQSRTAVGTAGQANSAGWSIATDTGMTTAANNIIAQNNTLETTYTTAVAISPFGISTIDNQNTFLADGVQGTAFGTFAGGVQQRGASGVFGDFGPVANPEFALDLYRILAKTNASGQVGGPLRQGTYEGSVLVDQAGNVSFVVVPEPSTAALAAAGLGALGFMRRRRK